MNEKKNRVSSVVDRLFRGLTGLTLCASRAFWHTALPKLSEGIFIDEKLLLRKLFPLQSDFHCGARNGMARAPTRSQLIDTNLSFGIPQN